MWRPIYEFWDLLLDTQVVRETLCYTSMTATHPSVKEIYFDVHARAGNNDATYNDTTLVPSST